MRTRIERGTAAILQQKWTVSVVIHDGQRVTVVTARTGPVVPNYSRQPMEETLRTNDRNDPINALYTEHDHALHHLQMLGRSGRVMAASGVAPEPLAEFRTAVKFLDTEIRAHNQWEEDHLFPILELYMGPGGPCSVMRAEHRTLWDTYGALRILLKKVEEGSADSAALEHLALVADAIVDLLGNHIHKENEILFPMARRLLRPADLEKLQAARPAA